jgi:hypothetical protein
MIRAVSEIQSITGRDVPEMPSDREHRQHWMRWVLWLYPVFALAGAVRHGDGPEMAMWGMLLLMMVVGSLLTRKPAPAPDPAAGVVLMVLLGVLPMTTVVVASNPQVRWSAVALLGLLSVFGLVWRLAPRRPD